MRRAPAAGRREPAPAGRPAAGLPRRAEESLEDRVGARAARRVAPPHETWLEMAGIVVRLLQPAPGGAGPPADTARAAPDASTEAAPASAAVDNTRAGATTTGPAAEPAARGTPAGRTGTADVAPRTEVSVPIDVPDFPAPVVAPPLAGPSALVRDGTEPASAPPAPQGEAMPEPTAAVETPGPGAHRRIVARWTAGVTAGATALPRAPVHPRAAAAAALDDGVAGARARHAATRAGLADEALSQVPPGPDVEDAPSLPTGNPVPEHTARITVLSDLRLPDDSPPELVRSLPHNFPDLQPPVPDTQVAPPGGRFGGNLPALGDTPVAPDLFQVLTTPGARALAELPPGGAAGSRAAGEAARVTEALAMLTRTAEPEDRSAAGERVITPDTGPAPVPPLPAALQAPVGQVVARVLARVGPAAAEALVALRREAYPDGVLAAQFPAIGSALAGELAPIMENELREIAVAAQVSGAELAAMVEERQHELAASADAAAAAAVSAGSAAAEAVADEGQRTMDRIEGAADEAEEETLRRQEVVGGGADPALIHARRDRTVAWIREHVTTQTTRYQQAGDRRAGELVQVRGSQTNAYRALVQREQYQVLTPQPPLRDARDPNNVERERGLADMVNVLRIWGDERVAAVTEAIRAKLASTSALTASRRSEIEAAGSAGIEAARAWAEERELQGQGWWARMAARFQRWLGESNRLTEQWHVRRSTETRDAVAADLQLIDAARASLAEGVARDTLLADERLTAQQQRLLRAFFEAGPDANPLDIAADSLRDNVALGHLERARQVFEAELTAMPVEADDMDTVQRLSAVLRAGSGFDAVQVARELHAAMDQMGTDEDRLFASLRGLTPLRGAVVRKVYLAMFHSSLDFDLVDDLSGDELERALAGLEGRGARADAIALHDAIAGWGTDEAAIMGLLRNKPAAEVEAIRAEYLALYGRTLQADLEADLAEGNELAQANALLSGNTAEADAIALDDAMRGGLTGWGTGEAEIEAVYARLRSEVQAQAEANHWTTAQRDAEIRRRLHEIERHFGSRYGDVTEYRVPGSTTGSLEGAFRSELSGADLDLAHALQANDPVAADAARIEIERTGFYASDERLRAVLVSQYERALEARRLDEGPARHLRVVRLVEELRRRSPALSEEEISRQRMALERTMEHEMEVAAQADSSVSMESLRAAYEGRYDRISLAYDMERMTSGTDRLAARAMLRQGGRLTPYQEIDYATRGDGTDEEALRRTLSRMTLKEINVLRGEWATNHPDNPSLDAMLRDELSGRDASDILDMAEHGAPESALARIDAERRRVRREMDDLTGVLGGVAAGNEAAWMQDELDRLATLEAPLRRTDWPDTPEARAERERLADDVDFRVGAVRAAVEDHRRRLDSYTDAVTQVVGIAVGVTVALVAGAVSGGTLGVATIAVMASLLSTASTMLSKQLILGGAYGAEDAWTDVAVGVADALTAWATAGMGERLLRPIRGRVGAALARVGRSGLAQGAARTPGVGGALRGVGRAVGGRAGLERAAASFLAEGLEDVVSSVPSTLTQLALTDATWQGDPLMNFLEGGGMAMLQSLLMGRLMAAGMDAGRSAFNDVRGHMRMGSDVGRLREANRLVTEAFHAHLEDNPGASLVDFMRSPEGLRLHTDLTERGLLPTLASVTAHAREAGMSPRAVDPDAPVRPEADAMAARAAELAQGLPPSLADGTAVVPDAGLAGRTVHVEPRWEGPRIVGVDVRAGPDATALDIALHAATVDAMQRYRGTLGNIRRVLENVAAVLTRSGLSVGSRGWEARLELGKLSAVVASRMEALSGRLVSPEIELRVAADLAHLQAQIDAHGRVLADPVLRGERGRGYVAAEDTGGQGLAWHSRSDAVDGALHDLAQAQATGDRIGEHRALRDLSQSTELPLRSVEAIMRMDLNVRKKLREDIRNLGTNPTPEALNALAHYGIDSATLFVMATDRASMPDAADLLGFLVRRAGPAAEAEPTPPAVPPRPSRDVMRGETIQRVLRGDYRRNTFDLNLGDPAWPARAALAAFTCGRPAPSFDEFMKLPQASQLLGVSPPGNAAERARLAAAYERAVASSERIRSAAEEFGVDPAITESLFAFWARSPDLGEVRLVGAIREWAVSGEPGPGGYRVFPRSLLDPASVELLAEVAGRLRAAQIRNGVAEDRLIDSLFFLRLSDSPLPQHLRVVRRDDGSLSFIVETAILPGWVSRRASSDQTAAANFNNDVREVLRTMEFFGPDSGLDGRDWHVMHLLGPVLTTEAGFGLALGPAAINIGLQTARQYNAAARRVELVGVEVYISELAQRVRSEGGDVWMRAQQTTWPRDALEAGPLRDAPVEFVRNVEYEIHISRPGQPDEVMRISIEASQPPLHTGTFDIMGPERFHP